LFFFLSPLEQVPFCRYILLIHKSFFFYSSFSPFLEFFLFFLFVEFPTCLFKFLRRWAASGLGVRFQLLAWFYSLSRALLMGLSIRSDGLVIFFPSLFVRGESACFPLFIVDPNLKEKDNHSSFCCMGILLRSVVLCIF